jgi:hypothetical protein
MKRYAITGFVIWAAATLALRFGGGALFRLPAAVLLLVSLPLMIAVALMVLRDAEHRALAAIALVAPGMLLDTISATWFPQIFPNLPASTAGVFGGWLLFCNIVVLLTAATMAPRRASESAAQSR